MELQRFEKEVKKFLVILSLMLLVSPSVFAYSLTYDTNKNNISMSYDSKNRILTKGNISYSYDSDMNDTLTNVTNNDVMIRYEYDSRKRVTKETKIIDGISFEKEINYDSMDRVTSEGGSINTLSFIYGNNTLIKTINNILNISYNEQNSPTQRIYGNNLVTNFTYNPNNFRLTRIKTDSKQNLNYEYDDVGNVKLINDTANLRTEAMSYDNLDRLTNVTRIDNGIEQYSMNITYNSIGNILNVLMNNESIMFNYGGAQVHAPSNVYNLGDVLDANKFVVRDSNNNNVAWFGDSGNIVLKGKCTISSDCVVPVTTDLLAIRNNLGTDLAYFDTEGNVFLRGTCSSGGSCDSASENSYIFKNGSGNNVAYIDSNGNLCVETGDCSDQSASCDPTSDAFIVQNSLGTNVSYVDVTGDLCLKGFLVEDIYLSTSGDYFTIKDNSDEVVSYINAEGTLCIETGDCSDKSALCNPTNNAFIIQNSSGTNKSYLDFTGDLCLTGTLVEDGSP